MTDDLPSADTAALDAVRADLRALGAATPPMPEALMARLDLALAEERRASEPAQIPAPEAPAVRRPRRFRWPRFLVAVATGVVVLAGISVGVTALWRSSESSTSGDSAARDGSGNEAPEAAAPDKASGAESKSKGPDGSGYGPESTEAVVLRSGRHYTRTDVTQVGTTKTMADAGLDASLGRLSGDAASLKGCFGAVEAAYPGNVDVADFGYFEDEPALVLHVSQVDGTGRVVAVGADCGVSGADELYTIAA